MASRCSGSDTFQTESEFQLMLQASDFDQVLALWHQQKFSEALHVTRLMHSTYPDDANVLTLLAGCEARCGNFVASLELYEKLVACFPNESAHWNAFGNVLRAVGDEGAARNAYERALAIDPRLTHVRANLGLSLLNSGDFAGAAKHLLAAVSSRDAEPTMRIWAAVACHRVGDDESSVALVQGWDGWEGGSDEAWLELGWLLAELRSFSDARRVFSRRFGSEPARVRARARYALVCDRLNEIDEARASLKTLPVPDEVADDVARKELLHAFALLAMREGNWTLARNALERALAITSDSRGDRPMYFALARACDQLGDRGAVVLALQSAHKASPPVRPAGMAWIEVLTRNCPLVPVDREAGDASSERGQCPVFVVGFPRSGTTLVEHMLESHPDFVGMDERPLILAAIGQMIADGLEYPAGLVSLQGERLLQLRRQYWKAVDAIAPSRGSRRVVDKNPLNMLALPMIFKLFPNASLILCRRHPCDAILSSYMQAFSDPEVSAISSSIDSLAHAYVMFDRQVRAQVASLKIEIFDLRYEDLVRDPQTMLAAMADYLKIGDHSTMLNFDETAKRRGYISTPSYAQVISPLNGEGVLRWQRYRDLFTPVLHLLEESVLRAGYHFD